MIRRANLSADMTLLEFYQGYVLPVCRIAGDADPKTISLDEIALKYWKRFTGDPPLWSVDEQVTAAYAMGLKSLPGRRGKPMSPNTQQTRIVHAQFVLDLAGPRTRKRRAAMGLIADEPPGIPKPKIIAEITPQILTLDEIGAWIKAADYARSPNLPNIDPTTWWRVLVTVGYNTALRIKTLMGLTWNMLDSEGWLSVPAGIYKGGRRGGVFYCNSHAMAALETIRGWGHEHIFPWKNWPNSSRWLQDRRAKLWQAAGIDQPGNGFHGLRRANLSWSAGQNDMAAKAIAGHAAGGDVLLGHYVDRRALVVDVLERLPQPTFRYNDNADQMTMFGREA